MKIYVLVTVEYVEQQINGTSKIFSSLDGARKAMIDDYRETIDLWKLDESDKSDAHWCEVRTDEACIHDWFDEIIWHIEEHEIKL